MRSGPSLEAKMYPTNRLEQGETVQVLEDRGDGKDACEFLATCPPFCPVIVHSSNYSAVPFMLEKLRGASWHAVLVTPSSEPEYAWVEAEWKSEIERLIREAWIALE